jgi:hypothetical protein
LAYIGKRDLPLPRWFHTKTALKSKNDANIDFSQKMSQLGNKV